MNRRAQFLLPLLRAVEERAGERRITVGSCLLVHNREIPNHAKNQNLFPR
jgi:hypothetical protein